ncbi:MAG: RNA polymerase sigma factor (sigma-70 family) [Bacteroidia bacterium]|jgi:RNA polymerase sigma factor (sigma-70 family)
MMAESVTAHMTISDTQASTKTLLQRCLDGERVAQKELYHTYCKAMYTLAYRITNDPDQANDVLQEAFIDVFRNLKSYKASGTLGSWIKTIVVRKATKQHMFDQRFETFEAKHDVGVDYHQFTSTVLEKEIFRLPEGYRTVFTLVEIEGYKHAEIAKMLNISESTSRTQLYHAKKTLQKRLKGERAI